MRSDGFCRLDHVLSLRWLQELSCTRLDVEKVVRNSDKKRFELVREHCDTWMIRAVQGHSIKTVDDSHLLRRLRLGDPDLPPLCVHGTYRRHLPSIQHIGLLAGGGQGQHYRNHIHFAPFNPGDRRVISGMRYDCEVAIWIDLQRALEDGVPFFMSANQVILSPGINGRLEAQYFLHAMDLQFGVDLI